MAIALAISVGAVSAVGILGARVEEALLADAGASLGGDRLLVSDRPIGRDWIDAAQSNGLRWSVGSQFPSVVVSQGDPILVAVKTVGDGYPLRGEVLIETSAGLQANPVLAPGSLWADPGLAARRGLSLGDELRLGQRAFRLAGLIRLEPDRGMSFVNFAPRVVIRHDELAATGLEQPGSRISYRLWLAADQPSHLQAFDLALDGRLQAGQRMETLQDARPEVRNALDRARAFLSLTSMVSLLIACAAMGLAARQLGRTQRPRLAVLKALGASGRTLQQVWGLALLLLVVWGGLAGLLLGLVVQSLLALPLEAGLAVPLAPAWRVMAGPALQAVGVAVLVVALFAWPALRAALRTAAVESLCAGHEPARQGAATALSLGRRSLAVLLFAAGLYLLMWLGSGQPLLAGLVAGGFGLVGLLMALGLVALLRLLGRALSARAVRSAFFGHRMLARSLSRRALPLATQVVGLSLALAAILLLSFVRTDLVEAWGRSLPVQAPNRFLLNILPGQEEGVRAILQASGVDTPEVHPMVRGRLVAINDRAVGPDQFPDGRAQRLLDREMNLSYAAAVPDHNRIVQGRPLQPDQPEVSVEQGMANTLGLGLGDWLSFDLAGEVVRARVTSIRSLRWDSMQVNFFMILTPSLIQEQTQSWITSFYVAQDSAMRLARQLLQAYPGVTLVELDALLLQIRRVLDQGVAAVQGLFLLGLVSGGLVLWAALAATRSERQREAALMRALGASRAQLVRLQAVELMLVGGLAGLIAAALAQGVGQQVAQAVFSLSVPWSWQSLAAGMAAGALVSVASGLLALWPVLKTPAVAALRLTVDGGR